MFNPVSLLNFSFSKQKVPLVLQNELSECGLACIAMVMSYHGHKSSIESLRVQYPNSLNGISAKSLIEIGNKVNLTSRALRLEPDQIKSLKFPAILHWDLDHFVVFSGFKGKSIIINDPAIGLKILTLDEFDKHFTGIAIEYFPTADFEKSNDLKVVRLIELWKSATGINTALIQLFVISFAIQVFVLIAPFFLQITIDQIIISNDQEFLTTLTFGFFMLAVIHVFSKTIRGWMILYLNTTFDIQLVNNVFSKLLKLPIDYFEKRHLGDVLSRFNSLKNIKDLFTKGLIESLIDGFMAIITMILMFIYSVKLAIVVCAAIIIYIILRISFHAINMRLKNESIILDSLERTNFMETIRGIQTIKLFTKENLRKSLWQNKYSSLLNSQIKLGRLEILFDAANQAIFPIATVLIVYIGANLIINGEFSVGMFYAFFAYQQNFNQSSRSLVDKYLEYKLLDVDLARLSDILYAEEENNIFSELKLNDLTGDILVKDLTYKYHINEEPIIDKLNFEIKAGESVAIIGPSGCGKSTLLKILLGILKIDNGMVFYDGIDLNTINKNELRKKISCVMQNDSLLSGTIAENITFFDPEPDHDKLISSAQIASIHNDIIKMPMQYNNLVGDMGTTLSGGQKQRILIARALYVMPNILFLDEASSHLDTENEKIINKALKSIPITKVTIAHRQETIKMADRIISMGLDIPIKIDEKIKII